MDRFVVGLLVRVAGLGWGWLGWAGQDANGNKGPAVAPIETDAAGLGWGWLGWAGQHANGNKSPAVGPRTRELETSRLQAWDLLARGFGC